MAITFPCPAEVLMRRIRTPAKRRVPVHGWRFTERASADRFEDAISLKGKPYSYLPTALSYRTELTQSCSCKVERKRGFAAFFEDATLVQGDIVVTEKGIYVFAGAKRFPYRESDFVPLSKARGVPRKIATYLAEIDRLMQ